MNQTMTEAWRADEVRRMDLVIRKMRRENAAFDKLVSYDERGLPDYPRPLLAIPRPKLTFKDLMKALEDFGRLFIP